MPPSLPSDELQQVQARFDRSAQSIEILGQAFHALGDPPATPEMDPLELEEMEHLVPSLLLKLLLALTLICLGLPTLQILIPLKLWSYLEGMICPKGQALAKMLVKLGKKLGEHQRQKHIENLTNLNL